MDKRTKCILHIGMPKTGTTSIQNFLSVNPQFLANKGLLYPNSGRVMNKHHDICIRLTEDIRSSLLQEVQQAEKHTLIISSELFWGSLDQPVANWINEHFNTTVVCFIRRQDKWIETAWRQMLKDSNYKKSSDLHNPLSLPEASWLHEWDARIRTFEQWFGPNNIRIRLYDTITDAVSVFLSTIGINSSEVMAAAPRLNKTMNPTWVQLLRIARGIPWDQHPLSALVRMLQDLPGPHMESPPAQVLSADLRNKIMERCYTCNEWIAKHYLTAEEAQLLLDSPKSNIDVVEDKPIFDDEAIALLISGMWQTLWPQAIARIYWDTGDGFSPSRSAMAKIGKRHDELIFDLPGQAIVQRIRFDPADVPVVFKMNYLQISSQQGENCECHLVASNADHVIGNKFCFANSNPSMIFQATISGPASRVSISATYLKFGADAKADFMERRIDDLQMKIAVIQDQLSNKT